MPASEFDRPIHPAVIAAKDIAAGSIGGMLQCVTGHPLDTIKVRMQTQPDLKPLKYQGLIQSFGVIIKEEGAAAVYKGVQSPLVGMSVLNAVMFFSYGQAKELVRSAPGAPLTISQYWTAGLFVGVAVAFVEGPVDLFKSQLQNQYGGVQKYSGLIDCARKIFAAHGVRGLYQGFSATLLRDIPANACYFGVYEMARKAMLTPGQSLETLPASKILLAGGLGGMAYWGFTFPADVIKSSMQTDSTDPTQRKYRGVLDCARQIYRAKGLAGFFRGFTPCMVRSFPSNAVCFFGYEYTRRLLG